MRRRLGRMCCLLIIAGLLIALWPAASASDMGYRFVPGEEQPGDTQAEHIPYDPFVRHTTLPRYPSYPSAGTPHVKPTLVKPDGIDLDVTYISRTPLKYRYDVWYTSDGRPYLRPGSESDPRWPSTGETVMFTAHVRNKGTLDSGPFGFKWYIDGAEVASGTQGGLASGQEATMAYQWVWAHTLDGERLLGQHTVGFVVDPVNTVPETYESNNSLTDRTDALSLVLAVTPDLYAALEVPVDTVWSFSAEDWLQKQIRAMNDAFARSVSPAAPDGIEERVRLDKILVTSTAPQVDWGEDGGFYMTDDDRQGNVYYDPATDVSGGLIHELSHQLGVIDLYNLNVPLEIPQVTDSSGNPVQMEYSIQIDDLMSDPGIDPPIYGEHTALAVNTNKGYRRGYYGEYLYDIPTEVSLRVLDNQGNPAPGVDVRLYQRASAPNMMGSLHGVIDNTPEIDVTTGADGIALLPNRPVGEPVTTHTGHTMHDNPFGFVNIVGINDEFLAELQSGSHQEFMWLDITSFNLAAWHGESTLEVLSHVAPATSPLPPQALVVDQERGLVALRWRPSPSTDVAGYNLYRTTGPDDAFTQVASGLVGLDYALSYDDSAVAVGYAVTAVDSMDRESGFSNMVWALRLWNPSAVVIAPGGERTVLDPQNGYALLRQSPGGAYRDTVGSYDLHLEYSKYLARAQSGNLIISHPGDGYSTRHSVRVTDPEANLLLEFGEQGTGPGQFETPAGVGSWGTDCSFGGPYAVDESTLLLLHLDGSYDGAQGETGSPSGTSFSLGRFGLGVLSDAVDTLTYPTAGNLEREQGGIEFWLQPQWSGGDGQTYVLFEAGNTWFNRLRIQKDGANNLRFMMWDSTTEYGVSYNIGHWQAGEWHHVGATWQASEMTLYVDGEQRDSRTSHSPDTLSSVLNVGSSGWSSDQANAVIDELRISSIPRYGNSDTCAYRFLVADSGNDSLQAFDSQGDWVRSFGEHGTGPGQFDAPQGLAVNVLEQVIVADTGNNRLQVLSFDGEGFGFLREIVGNLDHPLGVASYGEDRILVADTGNNKVKVFDATGDLLAEYDAPNDGHTGSFSGPSGVAADFRGNIVVADTGNRRVVTILGALPVWRIYLPAVLKGY